MDLVGRTSLPQSTLGLHSLETVQREWKICRTSERNYPHDVHSLCHVSVLQLELHAKATEGAHLPERCQEPCLRKARKDAR